MVPALLASSGARDSKSRSSGRRSGTSSVSGQRMQPPGVRIHNFASSQVSPIELFWVIQRGSYVLSRFTVLKVPVIAVPFVKVFCCEGGLIVGVPNIKAYRCEGSGC